MNVSFLKRAPHFHLDWFYLVAALIVIGDLIVIRMDSPRLVEIALLTDWALLIPALYLWRYRAQGKTALLRAIALSCLAIWVTDHIVPAEEQSIMGAVIWLRYLGLVGITIVEIKLVIMLWRMMFVSGQSVEQAQAKLTAEGMPTWAALLMALEGALYRKIWQGTKRLFRRK